MRTLAWRRLREYIEAGHADAHQWLEDWYRDTERADWSNFAEVRAQFPAVDAVGNKLIFNVRGNRYWLIVRVSYRHRRITIRWIGTHAEYNRLTRRDIEEL